MTELFDVLSHGTFHPFGMLSSDLWVLGNAPKENRTQIKEWFTQEAVKLQQ